MDVNYVDIMMQIMHDSVGRYVGKKKSYSCNQLEKTVSLLY